MDQARAATSQTASVEQQPDHGTTKWWTLGAVCLGTFMLLLDITIVNVALPDIQIALHSSFSDLQWVVDAYALTLAAMLLTAGSLADIYGRKLLYVVGLAVFTSASLLCGVASSTLFLQLARGLQGVGGAVMFSVSLALLADAFRGKDRGIAFGVWGAITGVAVAIGPLLGGLLTTGISWRWIFFVNMPLGVGAIALAVTKVAESRSPRASRPDWLGFVLFTAGLASLVYALIESNERGFSDGRVVGCFVAAGVLLAGFLVADAVVTHPMFDLRLFRLPTFTGAAVAAFGISATIFSMFLYLVLYIQDVLGYSALATGVRLLVASAGILAVATAAGRLSSHVPVRFLIGPGLLIVAVGLYLMAGLDARSTWTHLIPGLVVSGCGVGMINPPLASTAVGVVPPHQAGMASGINSTFRQVGIATGIALLGSLFSSQLHDVVVERVNRVPALVGKGAQLAHAIQSGRLSSSASHVPPRAQAAVRSIARDAFTSGLNRILIIAAVIAAVSGLVCLLTIRSQDLARHRSPEHDVAG